MCCANKWRPNRRRVLPVSRRTSGQRNTITVKMTAEVLLLRSQFHFFFQSGDEAVPLLSKNTPLPHILSSPHVPATRPAHTSGLVFFFFSFTMGVSSNSSAYSLRGENIDWLRGVKDKMAEPS